MCYLLDYLYDGMTKFYGKISQCGCRRQHLIPFSTFRLFFLIQYIPSFFVIYTFSAFTFYACNAHKRILILIKVLNPENTLIYLFLGKGILGDRGGDWEGWNWEPQSQQKQRPEICTYQLICSVPKNTPEFHVAFWRSPMHRVTQSSACTATHPIPIPRPLQRIINSCSMPPAIPSSPSTATRLVSLFFYFSLLYPKKKEKKKEIPRVIFTFFFVFWQNGSWKCYKGSGDKELVFRVQRTLKTLTRVELEVFFAGTERSNDGDGCDLKVRGSPFQRSCNIYKDADLVAQVHKK